MITKRDAAMMENLFGRYSTLGEYGKAKKDWTACRICGVTATDRHHVFNSANKKRSEKYGFIMDLCHFCHMGLHNNYDLWDVWKRHYQKKFELNYGTREQFIKEFGRSYL